ncbi:MAG TPA: nitrilase-related carbon-nitrogen hydrolase [Patescibacteria group bacterium]|nr:nitrilase-related carbon-nitrogen hydrolase [Patescibacteria group bacterium]
MHVVTVASEPVWKNPAKNIEQTERQVVEALRLYPKTQILLFPEINLMGAVDDESNTTIAESLDGYCVTEIQRIAKQHNVALICGMIEKNPKGKPFNTQFVVSREGELLTWYRKNHLFTESREPEVYAPGEDLVTFEFDGWKCGLSTCFDIRFPRLFETYKKAGVECMFSGFNWIDGRNKPAIMEYLVKARAHENQYFFVAVDRNGSDPEHSYYGTSVITNPYCEDLSERIDIYAYMELNKEDIHTLERALPLSGSFKETYQLRDEQ